ncbi:MAG: hypothetical protein JXA19_03660 [Anaerolineales bacterium]|nr:hypothetical protein [Anaerolineales bacterium]
MSQMQMFYDRLKSDSKKNEYAEKLEAIAQAELKTVSEIPEDWDWYDWW